MSCCPLATRRSRVPGCGDHAGVPWRVVEQPSLAKVVTFAQHGDLAGLQAVGSSLRCTLRPQPSARKADKTGKGEGQEGMVGRVRAALARVTLLISTEQTP